MSERAADLIERWLDGLLDDAGVAELEAAVLESAAVRREFWDRVAFHGLVREAAKMRFDAGVVAAPVVPAGGLRRPWGRQLVGVLLSLVLVGGFGVATVVTSLAWTVPAARRAGVVVHEEGFEAPPPPASDYVPEVSGVWSGDETEVVGGERGIRPYAGAKMLRFVSSHPRGDEYRGKASEIWRIIDLAALGDGARAEGAMAEITAVFNGVPVADRTIPAGGVAIVATDRSPNAVEQPWLYEFGAVETSPMNVAIARSEEVLDEDVATWQRLSAVVGIPPGARYLILHCHVEGRPLTGDEAWNPSGQYLDDIQLTVYPQRRVSEDHSRGLAGGGSP